MKKPHFTSPAWFAEQDRKTLKAVAAIDSGQGEEGDRRAIVWDICQSLSLRINLFEEIVFMALRRADVEASVIEQAEDDALAMTDIINEIDDADDDPNHPRLPELAYRFRRRMKVDELELWPAARAAGADLVAIRNGIDWAWQDEAGDEGDFACAQKSR